MAKKKAKLAAGASVSIRSGVVMPEFETLDISGWTGMILEIQGRGSAQKLILEWDDSTMQRLPDDYKQHCERQGLFYGMACIPLDSIEQPEE